MKFALLLISMLSLSFGLAAQSAAQPGFGTCKPVKERTQPVGCWILTDDPVGMMNDAQVFWHLHAFKNRASAEAVKTKTGTVVESLGRFWLLTIGPKDWKPKSGKPVAVIGPLSISAGKSYSALLMEAVMTPGIKSAVHTHSGPEAWYTESGVTCLETPERVIIGRPGAPAVVPQGAIMQLTAIGKETRQSIVLILHPTDEKPTTMDHTWQPKGICKVK